MVNAKHEDEGSQSEAASGGSRVKVIKRYTNRKLYDTVESRYVTLDEIAEMIRNGEEVRVIDNRTKEDLTSVTFAQIIFEQEKKETRMPLSLLRDIVRHGGDSLQDFFATEIQPRVAKVREGAEQLPGILRLRSGEGEKGGMELLTSLKQQIEEWQKGLGARFPDLQAEVSSLKHRVEELRRKLERKDREHGKEGDSTGQDEATPGDDPEAP
ncbi:MAG: transcriptional regulator [Deltaproteobacteria bacterium]|nr:MAG: transcriptional regulator [Deltaproteobacteria bacterium]